MGELASIMRKGRNFLITNANTNLLRVVISQLIFFFFFYFKSCSNHEAMYKI